MKPNIVFLDEYSLGGADLSAIRALGCYTGYETTSRDETAGRCREADIAITNKVPFDAATFAALPRLRLVCIAATGMNHIDLEAAAQRGVVVKNAAGYSTHAVTETTVGAAIALLRQSVYYDRYVRTSYAGSGRQFHFGRTTRQLHGASWGIVGLGAIGHEVARVAEALGCRVSYTSTSGVVRDEPYPALPLDELLSTSDGVDPRSAQRPHARVDRRPRTGADETLGTPHQRGARRHRRRTGAGRGARCRHDRRRGARRLRFGADRRRQSAARAPRSRPAAPLAPQRLVARRGGRSARGVHRPQHP